MNQLPNSLREALARQAVGDVHPSTDMLTAFVEHSLPSGESQRITDHLAKCGDCREVVFLASAAAEEPAGEEQELMPDEAVPRISPALQAKAKEAAPESPRRSGKWRWAWIPAAAVLLLGALLIQRSQLVKNAPQPSEMIARKESPSSATSAPPTAAVPPAPESSANPAGQKPLSKPAPAHGNPASASGTSSVVAPRAAGQLPSVLGETASLEPPSSPPPNAAILEYKHEPAAIPRQNSFVASDAQKPSTLALRSQPAPEKPQMGLLPAVVRQRQWRVTSDGHLEHSTPSGTWTPVLADQAAKFHAVSVVGDNVWAGGSGGVLFHSTDGGQAWNKNQLSEAGNVETAAIVSIRFSDEQRGVVTTDAGARWNTSDGGATWTKE
jgi:Photosynthesis system II assembly factor YCF48/Putative zinc-finger